MAWIPPFYLFELVEFWMLFCYYGVSLLLHTRPRMIPQLIIATIFSDFLFNVLTFYHHVSGYFLNLRQVV